MIEPLREKVEKLNEEMNREYYLHFSGQKETLELSKIMEKYRDLFSKEMVEKIKESNIPEKERFLAFSLRGYLEDAVKEDVDQLQTELAGRKVKVNGEEVSFYYARVLMVNEPEREKRRKIYLRRLEVVEETNGKRKEMWRKEYERVKELGYKNYTELCQATYPVKYKDFLEKCEKFLENTETLFFDRFENLLRRESRVRLGEAEPHDGAFALKLREFDELFPREKLIPTVEKFLLSLGIDLKSQHNVHIDLEVRERKHPRAFCAPVKIPDEIYLNHLPAGGMEDFATTLHELGHVEHFAWTEREHAPEYKVLGLDGVSEVYAFLFQYLLEDEEFLKEFLGFPDGVAKRFADLYKLVHLYLVRRYCGKFRYEMELHTEMDLENGGKIYARSLRKATGLLYPEAGYLDDLDGFFYSADYLLSWFAEAQLRETLREKFGRKWWCEEAGEFLKELWGMGRKYTIGDVLELAGWKEVDISVLEKELGC